MQELIYRRILELTLLCPSYSRSLCKRYNDIVRPLLEDLSPSMRSR